MWHKLVCHIARGQYECTVIQALKNTTGMSTERNREHHIAIGNGNFERDHLFINGFASTSVTLPTNGSVRKAASFHIDPEKSYSAFSKYFLFFINFHGRECDTKRPRAWESAVLCCFFSSQYARAKVLVIIGNKTAVAALPVTDNSSTVFVRLISFWSAIIGCNAALPALLAWRSCDIVQTFDDRAEDGITYASKQTTKDEHEWAQALISLQCLMWQQNSVPTNLG